MWMRSFLLLATILYGLTGQAYAVNPSTKPGNAAYTILPTDTYVITTTAFSASRTWTLPAAAATCIGQTCKPPANELIIEDVAGTLTQTNTLVIAPPSGTTINGNAANLILSGPGSKAVLRPTSANNWQAVVTGDYREVTVASGSAVSLTTATAATIATISLSQGVWDCQGQIARTTGATTSFTEMNTSISATTNTAGASGTLATVWATAANVVVGDPVWSTPKVRLALAATTNYFLVASDIFTASTNAAFGQITCIRLK